MSKLLNVSTSPHKRGSATTTTIMADVIIALLPVSAWGVYLGGWNALLVILTTVLTCVATEYLYQKLMKRPVTIHDLSAFVTGLLLALNLPADIPLWMCIVGAIFAILVVKQVFGGIGQNFMNPALAARCFMLISFGAAMIPKSLDGVSGATPLAFLRMEGAPAAAGALSANGTSLYDMFIGRIGGTIGETSVLMLLIGFIYLLVKKIISWRIPVTYIASFAVFLVLFGGQGTDLNYLGAHIFGGGLMLGAIFMATDYVTCPITSRGQIVYGVVLGILTGIFRLWGASPEGVSYAIIFGNLLVPLIEKVTIPRHFGKGAVKNV